MEDKISVIIPCHNVEGLLNKCYQSLVRQTFGFERLEIILVYDQSDDMTLSEMEVLKQRYPKQTVLISGDEKRQGPSITRNKGLEAASSEYIAYVDADDICDLHMLEQLYFALKEYDCDYAECGYRLFSKESELSPLEATSKFSFYDLTVINQKKELMLRAANKTAVWGRLFKKAFLTDNQIDFLDSMYGEDVYHTALSVIYAKRYCVTEQPLYSYYRNEQGIVFSAYNSMKMRHSRMVIERLLGELRERCIYDTLMAKYGKEFEFFCICKLFYDPVFRIIHETLQQDVALEDIMFFKDAVTDIFPSAGKNPYIEQCSGEIKAIFELLNE